MKVNFTITAMLHTTGECELVGQDDHIFVHPVNIHPVITLISEESLDEPSKERIRMMALHQLVLRAVEKVVPDGVEIQSTTPINMSPIDGEKN